MCPPAPPPSLRNGGPTSLQERVGTAALVDNAASTGRVKSKRLRVRAAERHTGLLARRGQRRAVLVLWFKGAVHTHSRLIGPWLVVLGVDNSLELWPEFVRG